MRYLRILILGIFGFTSATIFAQWTQPEGAHYSKIWVRSAIGDKAHALRGDVIETEAYRDFSLRFYNEYGLSENWTVVSYAVPIGYASVANNTAPHKQLFYIGPIRTGLRRAVLKGPLRVALSAHASYSSEYFEENLAPATATYHYKPVVGTWECRTDAQIGYGFSRYWTQLRLGLNAYTNPSITPAFTAHFQFGANLRPDLQLNFRSFTLWPFGEVVETNVAGAGQTRYISLGFGLSWWFTETIALSAGVDGAQFEESNASTPTPTLGVEWRAKD